MTNAAKYLYLMDNINSSNIPNSAFTLGEYRIDPGANQIRGPESATKVEPKAMAVLCVLARRSGETVGRDELLAAVWPGRVVVEETLTRAIGQLRAALSDTASKPAYIQTVPKQGYRLIAVLGTGADTTPAADIGAPPLTEPETGAGANHRKTILITGGVLLVAVLLLFWGSYSLLLGAPYTNPATQKRNLVTSMLGGDTSQRLIGIAVGSDPSQNYAVIEDGNSKLQHIYREGAVIGTVQIKKILPDRIILDSGSGEKILKLRKSQATTPVTPQSLAGNRLRIDPR